MFIAARAVLLSMRASEDFGCAEKLPAVEQIKPDCCRTPAVVSIFPDSAACVLSFYAPPLHYNLAPRPGRAERRETTAGWVTTAQTAADNPHDDGQPPTPPTPGTTTDDPASHQHHRRPRLATNTTDVVPQPTTPDSHQHHRRCPTLKKTPSGSGSTAPCGLLRTLSPEQKPRWPWA